MLQLVVGVGTENLPGHAFDEEAYGCAAMAVYSKSESAASGSGARSVTACGEAMNAETALPMTAFAGSDGAT